MILRCKAIFLFLFLPNLIFAGGMQSLVEENFGERFYGVYLGNFKLGYVIHEISQNEDAVAQDFSMNIRVTLSEEEQKQHKAKYAFAQTISRYQFNTETGLLNQMSEVEGKKYYANYEALLENNYFKQEISTLTAEYKGKFSYQVLKSDKNGDASKFLKLPSLHIKDYFAEINFIQSKPEIGQSRTIEVFDLDFENGVFMSATLTLKQKITANGGSRLNDEYVIQEDLDGETFTYKVDQFGNIIGAEMFGLNLIREPKEQALTLDARNI